MQCDTVKFNTDGACTYLSVIELLQGVSGLSDNLESQCNHATSCSLVGVNASELLIKSQVGVYEVIEVHCLLAYGRAQETGVVARDVGHAVHDDRQLRVLRCGRRGVHCHCRRGPFVLVGQG
jgi:hypothetical protein